MDLEKKERITRRQSQRLYLAYVSRKIPTREILTREISTREIPTHRVDRAPKERRAEEEPIVVRAQVCCVPLREGVGAVTRISARMSLRPARPSISVCVCDV